MKTFFVSMFDLLENKPHTFRVKHEDDDINLIVKKALKAFLFPDGFFLENGDTRSFDEFFVEETSVFQGFVVISIIETDKVNLRSGISFQEVNDADE